MRLLNVRLPFLLLLAALCVALAVPSQAQQNQNRRPVLTSEELNWQTDHQAALAAAKAEGRPMILYLYTGTAVGCRDMEQLTMRNRQVVDAMKDFQLAAVDMSRSGDLRRSLQIIRVPTVIFYSPSGAELFRAVGFKPAADFSSYLSAIERPKPRPANAPKAAAAKPAEVKVNFDPSQIVLRQRPNTRKIQLSVYAPKALTVAVMGEFNDWRPDTLPMQRHESGWWWIDLYLSDGMYDYMYYVDGKRFRDPRGEYRKFVKELGEYATSVIVGRMPGPEVSPDGLVTFRYYNREVDKVGFTADFLNFEPVPMFAAGDGNWGIQYTLPPGDYEYWFIVNDNMVSDEQNPIGGKRQGSLLTVKPGRAQ